MSKNTIGTGHPKVTCNVSGLSKPKIDWVTKQVANTWSDAAREAAAEARREKSGADSDQPTSGHSGAVLSKLADKADDRAAEASKYASSAYTQQSHQDAAHAHEDARAAHLKAAMRYKAEGNETMRKFHSTMADSHEARIDGHARTAEGLANARRSAPYQRSKPGRIIDPKDSGIKA